MENRIKKILIIRLSAIGDTIHTLPMVNALKRNLHDTQIHWVVEDKAQFFVEQAKNIDKVFVLPKKKWRKERNFLSAINDFSRIMNKLQHEKYDIAIDVQQLFKSGLVLAFCGAKRKISMDIAREFSGIFANEKIKSKAKLFDPNYHILKRYEEYLNYLGIDDTNVTFELKDFSQSAKDYALGVFEGLSKGRPTLVFAPATTWKNKHWQTSNWSKLFEHFAPKSNIIFTGLEKDNDLINEITQGLDLPYTNLAGKTTLEELAQVIKMSDLVVSPDSGTAHTAWVVEHPYVITIFTSTAKNRTGPIGEKCFSFAPDLNCSPCLQRKCSLKQDRNKCMRLPEPQIIIDKIEELLFK